MKIILFYCSSFSFNPVLQLVGTLSPINFLQELCVLYLTVKSNKKSIFLDLLHTAKKAHFQQSAYLRRCIGREGGTIFFKYAAYIACGLFFLQ